MVYDYNECSTLNWHTTEFGEDYDRVAVSSGWSTCSIVDGHPQGALYIEVDGVRFVSYDTELTESDGTGYVAYTDFHTQN